MSNAKMGLMGLTLNLYKKNIPALISSLEKFSGELNATLSKTFQTVYYPVAWNKQIVSVWFRFFEKQKVDGISKL